MDIALIIGSIVGSLGFWELVKYLLLLRANKRKAESEADASEFSVLGDFFARAAA